TIMAHIFFQHAKGSRYTKPALVVARVAIVVLVAAAVLVQPKPLLLNTRAMKSGHREIVYHEEGRAATVSVVKNMDAAGREWGRFLFINVLFAADVDVTHVNRQYYSGLSLIPTVLHPNPKHVFVAGLASGASTGAAALDERTERVTCVELLPEVIRGGKYFAEYNYHAMDNPKIDIIRDDARAYLETTDETYDIIVTDCFISAITGTAALYSLEYFKLCARRLKPGGFMSVGAGHLTGTDRSIARTFIEAFPEVAVFAMDTGNPDHNPTFLIGANEPIRFSRESIVKAFQQDALRIELTRFAIPAADTLIASYLCTGKDLLPYILDTESCTDDKPTIDFLAVTWIEGFTPEFVRVGTSDIWALKPQLADLREFPYLNP
ncbi:MAG: fused MFS/spermidine synthase, partial [Candidatus Eisenbacteria sp.]|nr:fused MFS/spermidine synthase [Candidatus Eisenbacteria bacterium]